MKTTEIGFFIIVLTVVFFVACADPPPRNLNAPPPAPTSARIANINASDLQKMRRSNNNASNGPSDAETKGKDVSSSAENKAPGPKKQDLREGEEKKDEDDNDNK